MAGRRHRTGRARLDHLRLQRRLAQLDDELAAARTHAARVAAAADFLRGALKHTDTATADALTDEVVRLLTEAGTRALTTREARSR